MCGNRRSRLQGKNGGICVMMSNSTFLRPYGSKRTKFERPLGFLHSNTELVTCVASFYIFRYLGRVNSAGSFIFVAVMKFTLNDDYMD